MREQREVIRYSVAFQRKVVREIESGQRTIESCRRLYDIGGKSTIQRWLRRHGKAETQRAIVRVRMRDEADERQQDKERIAQLERALAEAHLDRICALGLVDALAEAYGEESVKKNIGRLPLSDQKHVQRLWRG